MNKNKVCHELPYAAEMYCCWAIVAVLVCRVQPPLDDGLFHLQVLGSGPASPAHSASPQAKPYAGPQTTLVLAYWIPQLSSLLELQLNGCVRM